MERITHTPLVEVAIPWSTAPARLRCLPFYSHRESERGCELSNLYPCEVTLDTAQRLTCVDEAFLVTPDGVLTFASSESAFQCAKALLPLHDRFVRALSPIDAAKAGQGRLRLKGATRRSFESLGGEPFGSGRKSRISESGYYPRRAGWSEIKLEVMARTLAAKFDQHPELWGEHLVEPTYFIEHTQNDDQWGDALDGSGTNFLGKLLTALSWETRRAEVIDRHTPAFRAWLRAPNRDLVTVFYRDSAHPH